MSDIKQAKIGGQVSCGCGAVYEFCTEGRPILEKDDARCRFCRSVITAFPLQLGWRVVKWPDVSRPHHSQP